MVIYYPQLDSYEEVSAQIRSADFDRLTLDEAGAVELIVNDGISIWIKIENIVQCQPINSTMNF